MQLFSNSQLCIVRDPLVYEVIKPKKTTLHVLLELQSSHELMLSPLEEKLEALLQKHSE